MVSQEDLDNMLSEELGGVKITYYTEDSPRPFSVTLDKPPAVYINSEQNIMFDVDDTLVMHTKGPADLILYNDMMECNVSLNIHDEHIKQLKSHYNRGFKIFVWSGNGAAWCRKVIEALGLQNHVDFYMTKPVKFFDDLPAEQVLVNRVYLPYKNSLDIPEQK